MQALINQSGYLNSLSEEARHAAHTLNVSYDLYKLAIECSRTHTTFALEQDKGFFISVNGKFEVDSSNNQRRFSTLEEAVASGKRLLESGT